HILFDPCSLRIFLDDLADGQHPSQHDIRFISDIITNLVLTLPFMNVAIYYFLLQSNIRLSKAYLEKIASHCSRLGLETGAQAMEHAQQEIQPKQKRTQRRNTKQQSQEVIPDWFEDSKRSNTNTVEKKNQSASLD